jgi:hypothetical protein
MKLTQLTSDGNPTNTEARITLPVPISRPFHRKKELSCRVVDQPSSSSNHNNNTKIIKNIKIIAVSATL